ncbi:bet V I allergen [Colletotrichum truncatum]|uniref:Bet V I allergen n=1 Tax=Colletotrichum truncatum TaxID=5467 RepID=A0ACC3Z7V6_COLTU|nr:bet V I allergen [Colletotrichum truncatum]KAF6783727.1 bet V I allergen [Colletotrichum truncatum]
MDKNSLIQVTVVTREIDAPIGELWGLVAGFGAEKPWYPGAKSVSLKGFGLGSIRTFNYVYPEGKNKGQEYTFSEELTEVDASKHSMTFRVRRPDYPDLVAYGTTALDSLGPNKTRFRWIAESSPLPEEFLAILQDDLNGRFDSLITAMANQLSDN